MLNHQIRFAIYAHDVALLAGVHVRTARRILNRIRNRNHKPPGSVVTVAEFCDFMKLDEEAVRRMLV